MQHTILILALAFATTAAFAHPGKTDAKGGHVDSKTGKYHMHKKPEPPKKAEAPKKTAPPKKKK